MMKKDRLVAAYWACVGAMYFKYRRVGRVDCKCRNFNLALEELLLARKKNLKPTTVRAWVSHRTNHLHYLDEYDAVSHDGSSIVPFSPLAPQSVPGNSIWL